MRQYRLFDLDPTSDIDDALERYAKAGWRTWAAGRGAADRRWNFWRMAVMVRMTRWWSANPVDVHERVAEVEEGDGGRDRWSSACLDHATGGSRLVFVHTGLGYQPTMQQRQQPDPSVTAGLDATTAQDEAWRSLGSHVNVVLRPVASPTSLGLFGLAAATFTLSGLQLGWVPASEGHHVAVMLIGFAAVAQLVASLVAFVARDGTVATVMGVLSLTWLSVGLVMLTSPAGSRRPALGLLLLASALAVGLSGLTAALSKLGAALVFVTAAVRLFLTGIFHLTGSASVKEAAGLVGLLLFVIAVYVAWASELEGATGKTVLPVGRRGKGLTASQGTLLEQVRDLTTEPGIRTRL
jgi:succinate-acetate transporter protein